MLPCSWERDLKAVNDYLTAVVTPATKPCDCTRLVDIVPTRQGAVITNGTVFDMTFDYGGAAFVPARTETTFDWDDARGCWAPRRIEALDLECSEHD